MMVFLSQVILSAPVAPVVGSSPSNQMYGQCFLWITAKLQAVHEAHGLGLEECHVLTKISKLSSQQVITHVY
jgi:hypothetical protein